MHGMSFYISCLVSASEFQVINLQLIIIKLTRLLNKKCVNVELQQAEGEKWLN